MGLNKVNHVMGVLAGVLLIFLVSPGFSPDPEREILKAGVSKIIITPEKPTRMSGYEDRTEPFKGVHDDLYASALVIEDKNTKACIVTADVIGFSHDFIDDTRQLILKETGIPESNIMIIASHNHGGPRTLAYGEEPNGDETEYVESLRRKIVQAINEATRSIQPVQIGATTGTCKMNVNRRAKHADGGIWLGRNPAGVCDHQVGIIRLDDLKGKTIGFMVNWPCHATTGGHENYMITADWPGAAAREIGRAYPDAIVLVGAGASGDINPIYGPNNNFNDIEAIGQTLAEEVIRASQSMNTYPLRNLDVSSSVLRARGKKPGTSRMPNVSLEPGPNLDIRLTSLKVGNILIAGISGELMTEIGLQVKSDSPYKNTVIYTHCNGNSGYLCTDKAYSEGGYEPMVSRTMPGTEALITDAFRKINNEL